MNERKPKVSVITATYNDRENLRRIIRQVVSQSYDNIEYIIVDGGSTDGTLEVIREGYDGFVRWNQFLQSRSDNWIVTYSYYGDWAAPAYACQSEEFAVSAVTPGELMSTGYFYYNTKASLMEAFWRKAVRA